MKSFCSMNITCNGAKPSTIRRLFSSMIQYLNDRWQTDDHRKSRSSDHCMTPNNITDNVICMEITHVPVLLLVHYERNVLFTTCQMTVAGVQREQPWISCHRMLIPLMNGQAWEQIPVCPKSPMAEWLQQTSQCHERYWHNLEVMSSNPSLFKLGVHSTSVQSRTWTPKNPFPTAVERTQPSIKRKKIPSISDANTR